MEKRPEHYWTPQNGEKIVGIINYRDFLVIATDLNVYTIKEKGQVGLDDHVVQRAIIEWQGLG